MKRIEIEKLTRNIRRYAYFLLLLCILAGCGQKDTDGILLSDSSDTGQDGSPIGPDPSKGDSLSSEETFPSEEKDSTEPAQIYVHVAGAVVSPGVYALASDARVFQVIEKAGGLTDEAYAKTLNQAEPLSDGQMVYVMTQEEAAAQASAQPLPEGQGESADDGRVNLNTATESDLMALPGIGTAKAKSILTWREENGGFSKIEDLMKVQGIKEGVFSKIKDSIKVE